MRRSGFTLTEMAATLAVLVVLVGIGVPTYQNLRAGNDNTVAHLGIAAVAAEWRLAAAASYNTFPELSTEMLATLSVNGVTTTTGPSSGLGQVSVARVDTATVILAASDGQGSCRVKVDRLRGAAPAWGVGAGSCDASGFVDQVALITGTETNPTPL
jgi:prepilin-type N-terminal cleavage/methylation domain-containing protein